MKKTFRKPYRIKRKKSIVQNRFFGMSVLILTLTGSLFYFAIFSSTFQIKEIRFEGNEKVLIENVRSVIQEQINKKILFFSTKSIFLANLSEINKILLERFPQIAKIESKRQFSDKLTLIIEERKPVAIFSREGNYFYIDEEGVIFEKITEVRPLEFLEIQNQEFKKESELGDRVIPKELLSRILEVKSKLQENLKILVKRVFIIPDERINVETFEGWQIYFNSEEDIDWQLTKLSLVLEKKIPPEKREDLEYIELRFGNRAYFKYKD